MELRIPDNAPRTEFSLPFVQGMLDRMLISFFKYGPVADAYPDKVNALESLKLRLQKYEETGNTEYLIDASNFAMIEFMRPRHPAAFYKPTDSDQSPGRVWNSGEMTQQSHRAEPFSYKRNGD